MAQFPADPKRDAAAEALAKTGHTWARVTLREAKGAFPAGSKFFGVPSSKADGSAYYTNLKMCTCPDYQERGAICKHMRAVALYAAELRKAQRQKQQAGSAVEADPTRWQREAIVAVYAEPVLDVPSIVAEARARRRYEDIYPGCAAGCGDLVERRGEKCYACVSAETRRLETAEKRAAVGARA